MTLVFEDGWYLLVHVKVGRTDGRRELVRFFVFSVGNFNI